MEGIRFAKARLKVKVKVVGADEYHGDRVVLMYKTSDMMKFKKVKEEPRDFSKDAHVQVKELIVEFLKSNGISTAEAVKVDEDQTSETYIIIKSAHNNLAELENAIVL